MSLNDKINEAILKDFKPKKYDNDVLCNILTMSKEELYRRSQEIIFGERIKQNKYPQFIYDFQEEK